MIILQVMMMMINLVVIVSLFYTGILGQEDYGDDNPTMLKQDEREVKLQYCRLLQYSYAYSKRLQDRIKAERCLENVDRYENYICSIV